MYSISKEFVFEYSHRLNMDYPSPCKNLHGHSAKVIITIWSNHINENGMIIDFAHLNPIKTWIDKNLDHSLILNSLDPLNSVPEINDMKKYLLDDNPTSEVMANMLWIKVAKILNSLAVNWEELEITFYETRKNYATYKRKYKYI